MKSISSMCCNIYPDAHTLPCHGKIAETSAIDDDNVPAPAQEIGPLLTSMTLANKHAFAGSGAIAENASKTERTTAISISNKT
jgi:hypothetical protein